MTDFDRNEYWKKRASDKIKSLFADVTTRLKEIRNDVDHVTGKTNHEFMNGVLSVGDGFDMMQAAIENIGKKKDVQMPPKEPSPTGEGAKKA